MTPAFGSISKRDFDISFFMALQRLGAIDRNPEIYELVSQLKMTRSKARSLLHDAKLRSVLTGDLDEELRTLVANPIFFVDGEKNLGFEVSNPYLVDHLRFKLKKLKFITDGLFSPELVKMTRDAYLALFFDLLPEDKEKSIHRALVKAGARTDPSLKEIMRSTLVKIGRNFLGQAGEDIVDDVSGYLAPILSGQIELIKDTYLGFFDE